MNRLLPAQKKQLMACHRTTDLPVIKDLMTDLVSGISSIPRINTCDCGIIPKQEDIERIKPLRDCIECLSCVSVCPAMKVTDFLGPTSMRSQMRIALDPREPGNRVREAISQGLFTCTSCNRCWRVCPKNIETPGKAIEKLYGRLQVGEGLHYLVTRRFPTPSKPRQKC